ncbi:MAG: PQQ-binding-like beta-propeller repeat protein [Planctomycetes bacterium]|nr:PQQ-binding-like beta-propeller repeat protein [Planctomycetota bacterium]
MSDTVPASDAEWDLVQRAVERGWITRSQVEECVRERERSGGNLTDLLVHRGYLTSERLRELRGQTPGPATIVLPEEVSRLMPDPAKRIGKYVNVNPLGSGGMGVVFRAYDTRLHRWVALKFLKSIGDDTARAYFEREARIAAALNHPNIAAIHEVGEHESAPYIAMQLIDGENLFAARKRMSRPAVVRALREAAEAVDYAHRQGIVHRDLKPNNLMLDREGRVFVMDFGLSKQTEVDGRSAGLSGSNVILGTPAYMAPEQARGDLKSVDPQSDVYSLGATLYEMLTGVAPFASESPAQILLQVLNSEPLAPRRLVRDLPRDLETIVLKCLEKEKSRRYASAGEFAQDLTRFERGEAILAHPPSMAYRMRKRLSRHKSASAAIAAAALIVLGVAAYFLGPARVEIQTPDGPVYRTYWPAGRYTVPFAREGYDREEAELLLQPWRTARWSPTLEPDHGFVEVKTTPPRASVSFIVAGRPLLSGRADGGPFRLPKGTHEMRLDLENHVAISLPVFVAAGKTTPIERSLEHEKGAISVTCRPDGVALVVGGRIHSLPVERLDLETGRHELTFEKFNHFPRKAGVVVRTAGVGRLHASLVRMDLWSFRAGTPLTGRPAIADLDGDGVPDAVVGSLDGKLHALSGRDGARIWEAAAGGEEVYSPCLADLDADGVPDAVAAADDAGVVAVSGRDGRRLWRFQAGGSKPFPAPKPGTRASPAAAAADLDGDGVPDAVVPTITSRVVALSGRDGKLLWEFAAEGLASCALADLDGDGVPDCVAGSGGGKLTALSGRDGKVLWKTDTGRIEAAPALADLNRDGVPDVMAGSLDGCVSAFSGKDGSLLWRFRTDGPVQSSPALTQLDADGVPDAFVGSDDGSVYAVSGADGSWIWIAPAGSEIRSSPSAADLDGDGVPDAVVGTKDGHVCAFSGEDGAPLWRFRTDGPVPGSPVSADLDADGCPDVAVGSSDGRLYALAGSDRSRLWEVELASEPWKSAVAVPIDEDAMPDLVVAAKSWGIHAFSGSDGSRLWEIQAGFQVDGIRLLPDADGDGVADLLLVSEKSQRQAISGRDGRALSVSRAVEDAGRPAVLIGNHVWSDLDRDGRPERLAVSSEGASLSAGETSVPIWILGRGRPIAVGGGRIFVADGRRIAALLPLASRLPVSVMMLRGLYPAAIAETTRRLEAGGERGTLSYVRGLARARLDDLAGAIFDFSEARRHGLRSPELYAGFVEVLVKTDRLTPEDLVDLPPSAVPLLHDGTRFSSADLLRLADRMTGTAVPMLLLALKGGEALEALRKSDPYDPRVLSLRALAHLQGGDEASARADIERAILLGPYDPFPRRLLKNFDKLPNPGTCVKRGDEKRRDNKKLAEARIEYDLAIRMKRDDAAAYHGRGLLRSDQGDAAGALEDYSRAIEIEPRSAAWCDRGIAKRTLGDLDGAIADFTKAIELKTDVERAYLWRGKAKADRKDWDGAIADYDEVLRRNPKRTNCRYFRGVARYNKGDLDGALADFDAEIGPLKNADSITHYYRGLVKRDKGDIDGAIADLTRAIEMKSFAYWSYIERGRIKSGRKEWDGAIADFKAAIDLEPKNASGYFWRGETQRLRGRSKDALLDFEKAISLDGRHWRAYAGRGRLRYAAGSYAAALADFEKVVELCPEWGWSYYYRGETRRRMEDPGGAIADFTRAIELDPANVPAWYGRGLTRDSKGDLDGAIADYQKALELGGSKWSERDAALKKLEEARKKKGP